MYYVYILKMSDGRLYVGSSGNLKQRLESHGNGLSEYTSKYLPVKLYYECYSSKTDALIREKFLKTGRGREILKKQLKNTLENI